MNLQGMPSLVARWACGTLCLGALLMAGCGGEAPAPATSDAPAAKGALRIAVIPKGLSHQFWLTVKAGAEAAGKEAGAEILWQGPAKETEIVRQINIVQDMINSNVSAIVMAACDSTALIQPIDQALKAGIPVITIDSGVNSDLPLSFVATDNVAAARAGADKLAELIGGAGQVGVIPFVAGAGTSEMREQGFKEGMAAHSGVQIVATLYCDSDVAKAMNAAQDMMTANPELKGIFAANEAAAIGAAQAIRAAGKAGQVKLVAFDGSEEEINGLKEGVIQALIVQRPFEMGNLGVKAALNAIAGKPVDKRIDTGVTIVTMENFNEPEIQKLLNPLS